MTRRFSPPGSFFAAAATSAVISARSASPANNLFTFSGEPVEAFSVKRSVSLCLCRASAISAPLAYRLPPASPVPIVSQVNFFAFFARPRCTAQAEKAHKKARQSAITARFFLAADISFIPRLLSVFGININSETLKKASRIRSVGSAFFDYIICISMLQVCNKKTPPAETGGAAEFHFF